MYNNDNNYNSLLFRIRENNRELVTYSTILNSSDIISYFQYRLIYNKLRLLEKRHKELGDELRNEQI